MKKPLSLILLAAGLFASSLRAASVDYYLRLDGVDGESADSRHMNEIQILSYSWGMNQTSSIGGSGGGTGKASFSDMTFTTQLSKASPMLMLACASGQHVKMATFTAHRPGGDTNQFFKVVLTDVLVTSYQSGGSEATGEIVPTDQFSVNFGQIKFEHTGTNGVVTSGEATRPVPQ